MDSRLIKVKSLQSYLKEVDKEITIILQNLQWDRKHLTEGQCMVGCQYDSNHKVPADSIKEHEEECFLKKQGYSKEDKMLPDPPDIKASTLVKFSDKDIKQIIENASKTDPLFRKGVGGQCCVLTLGRLQCAYSADERRAVHDAAVRSAPATHDLADLALPNPQGDGAAGGDGQQKSRLEILSELRDMRRRRARYRGPSTRNYSDQLRELIRAQMEFYISNTETEAIPDRNQSFCQEKTGINKTEHLHKQNNVRDEKEKCSDNVKRERIQCDIKGTEKRKGTVNKDEYYYENENCGSFSRSKQRTREDSLHERGRNKSHDYYDRSERHHKRKYENEDLHRRDRSTYREYSSKDTDRLKKERHNENTRHRKRNQEEYKYSYTGYEKREQSEHRHRHEKHKKHCDREKEVQLEKSNSHSKNY